MVQLEDTIYRQLTAASASQAEQIIQLKAENLWLKEQLGLAKKRLYSPSSEQSAPAQEALVFNEAEQIASGQVPDQKTECITYTRRKSKGKREADLAGLPVEEIFYRLPDEQQVCPQCQGALHQMGEDVRQEIKVIPASLTLVRHIRCKYACRHCQQEQIKTPILTASMPAVAFPNSLASASAVAHIMRAKFVEGLPLYRQEQSFSRLGFEISRQTMANWMIAGAGWLQKLYLRMQAHLLEQEILHADETSVQVLKEAGRAAQSNSYMWLYRTGRDGPPIVVFEYQTTRDGHHAEKFLAGFSGFLHVDGYAGYEKVAGVRLCGCFAHARRKFVDAVNLLPEDVRLRGGTTAHDGLAFINKLFAIERDLAGCSNQERLAGREAKSRKVVEDFGVWLEEQEGKVLPKSTLATAVNYCRNQWKKLTVFLEDGRLELDNNRSERSIKPFVIGRKNWLFANTPRGAQSSAVIYSIVETAKENGLNPFGYLTYLFEQLPTIDLNDPHALDRLLPWSPAIQAQFHPPAKSSR